MAETAATTPDDVLRCLFEQGVPVTHLLSVDRVLSTRTMTRATTYGLSHFMSIHPGCSRSMSAEEIQGFLGLVHGARRRREQHLANLEETRVALAQIVEFRAVPALVDRVVHFLQARSLEPTTIRTKFFCLRHGCRAVLGDAISAVDHIRAEHSDEAVPLLR